MAGTKVLVSVCVPPVASTPRKIYLTALAAAWGKRNRAVQADIARSLVGPCITPQASSCTNVINESPLLVRMDWLQLQVCMFSKPGQLLGKTSLCLW